MSKTTRRFGSPFALSLVIAVLTAVVELLMTRKRQLLQGGWAETQYHDDSEDNWR